jgi:hypothetical protein
MTSKGRKRKRRNPGYKAPPRRGEASSRELGEQPAPPPRRTRSRAGRERPKAPWGSFPLVELIVLLSLFLLIAGFFVQGAKGITMIAAGITLGSLAGLELSVREHFAGYRSHSTVLAGAVTVVVVAVGFFLLPRGWPQGVGLLVGAGIFAATFYLFREAFRRRSGGLGFR